MTAARWNSDVVGNLENLRALTNVQQAIKRDTFTTTSTSYTDVTGLSVTITPTFATSKILVMANIQGSVSDAGNTSYYNVLRGATSLGGTAEGNRLSAVGQITAAAGAQVSQVAFVCLDSPGVATATTYKVQMAVNAGSGFVNRTGDDANSNTRTRTVSSITVIEIPA